MSSKEIRMSYDEYHNDLAEARQEGWNQAREELRKSIRRPTYSSHRLSRASEEVESFGWRSEDFAISHHRRLLFMLLPNASDGHTFIWLEGNGGKIHDKNLCIRDGDSLVSG